MNFPARRNSIRSSGDPSLDENQNVKTAASEEDLTYRITKLRCFGMNKGLGFFNNILKRIPTVKNTKSLDEEWESPLIFSISTTASVIGLGNLVYGPATIISEAKALVFLPLFVIYTTLALPLILLYFIVGQYSGKSYVTVFDIFPIISGIGICFLILNIGELVNFFQLVGLVIFYLSAVLSSRLPWSYCRKNWIQYNCYRPNSTGSLPLCNVKNTTSACKCSLEILADFNQTHPCFRSVLDYDKLDKRSKVFYCSGLKVCLDKTAPPSVLFYDRTAWQMSQDPDVQYFVWPFMLFLLIIGLGYVYVYYKGLHFASKVSRIILLIEMSTAAIVFLACLAMAGSGEALKRFFSPDWNALYKARTWKEALFLTVYSLDLLNLNFLTMGSRNRVNSNLYHSAIFVCVGDFCYTFIHTLIVYMVIREMHSRNIPTDYENQLSINTDYTFVMILDFVTYVSGNLGAIFLSIWYLAMAAFTGLDTFYWFCFCIIVGMCEKFPILRKYHVHLFGICTAGLWLIAIVALIFGKKSSVAYNTTFLFECAVFLCLCAFITIIWFYGERTLIRNLREMIGYRPQTYWFFIFSWLYICPIAAGVVVIHGLFQMTQIRFFILAISPIPILFIHRMYHTPVTESKERIVDIILHKFYKAAKSMPWAHRHHPHGH